MAPCISIHTLLAESDFHRTVNIQRPTTFLSTLSLRRATNTTRQDTQTYRISIHTLLAESDTKHSTNTKNRKHFYPHSPCGERHSLVAITPSNFSFLSTLSLRRATTVLLIQPIRKPDFYPHSPCGERRVTVLGVQHRTGISIHTLLAESDGFGFTWLAARSNFYPHSPCGERRH